MDNRYDLVFANKHHKKGGSGTVRPSGDSGYSNGGRSHFEAGGYTDRNITTISICYRVDGVLGSHDSQGNFVEKELVLFNLKKSEDDKKGINYVVNVPFGTDLNSVAKKFGKSALPAKDYSFVDLSLYTSN